jgi:hypothetical protein
MLVSLLRNGSERHSESFFPFFVCTPGLPYKDFPVYSRINWRIFSPTSSLSQISYTLLADFRAIFPPLYRMYTLSMFQICFPTFKLRKGIPSCVLFRGIVRNGIPRICIYFGSTERKFKLCSLP